MTQPFLVATAGHVDHGKSALVQALTGTNPDRWAEEKVRGITIDLGFAACRHENRTYAFVDVPGHERFVHNMLAGVGCLDAALLVIAADESVMPQTREHATALHFLRVPRVVVILSKVDCVDAEMLALVHEELDAWLPQFGWDEAARVPFSKHQPATCTAVLAALAKLPKTAPAVGQVTRFAVDRVFAADGAGTVVTGVTTRGALATEEPLWLSRDDTPLRLRRLQIHGAEVTQVPERSRAAINLARIHYSALRRGDTLTSQPAPYTTKFLLVRLTLFDEDWAPGPKHRFHLHFLSRHVQARLLWRQDDLAMLALDQPADFWVLDRGLLRDLSPLTLVAGFEVMHPHPPESKRRAVLRRLTGVLPADTNNKDWGCRWWRWAQKLAPSVITRTLVLRWWGRAPSAADVADWVALDADHWVTQARWSEAEVLVLQVLEAGHREAPYRAWLDWQNISATLQKKGLTDLLLERICAGLQQRAQIYIRADRVGLCGREPRWSLADRRRLAQFLSAYDAVSGVLDIRLLARARKQTADLEHWLHRCGYFVWLSPDLMIAAETLYRIQHRLARDLDERGLSVQQLKAWFGFSRKTAIPLLEWMDHAGWTRREGDVRLWLQPDLVAPDPAWAMAPLTALACVN